MRGVTAFCAAAFLLAASPLDAATIEVVGMKYYSETESEYRYEGEICVEDLTADAVSAMSPGSSTWEPLTEESPDDWFLESSAEMTLAELQTGMAGSWTLRVNTGTDVYDYAFDLAAVQESDFLAMPEVTSPSSGADVDVDYTFTWENNDAHLTADGYVATVEHGAAESRAGWMADGSMSSLPQTAESWSVHDMFTGAASFDVGYGVYLNLISNTVEPTGAPDITDWRSVAVSGDEVEFNIVPEPVTLSLLALGGAALLRRAR